MGLWEFIKSKGKPLVGEDGSHCVDAAALSEELRWLGLDASGLEISVEGDHVKLSGTAACQDTKEKVILAVGNVVGIARVEDSVPSATEPEFYTVVPGDTLWGISTARLGDGARHDAIFKANRPMLTQPDRIYPGQVLRLPQD